MANASCGNIARINLSTGTILVEPLDERLIQTYIGGRGLGTKLACDEGLRDADPSGSHNKLIFAAGPMTDAGVPSSGRYAILTQAPDTGTLTCSSSGTIWGARLKAAGLTALIVEGEAPQWTYINIVDDHIELLPADPYLGLLTDDLTARLKETHGSDSSALSIGIAGEKQDKSAAIMNDGERAAGRHGIGAVMGAKKLKAIVVSSPNPHTAQKSACAEALQSAAPCGHCPKACGRRIKEDEHTRYCNAYGLDAFSVKSPEKEQPSVRKKSRIKASPQLTAVIDSLGLCLFTASVLDISDYSDLLNEACGTNYSPEEVLAIGQRICDLE